MVLKREEIIKEVEDGRIIINPFDQNSVKEASVELTVGEEIGIFRGDLKIVNSLNPGNTVIWQSFTRAPYYLEPNEALVCKTGERITLPLNICGWITPRGRMVIFGLSLFIAPGFVQPNTKDESLFFLVRNVGRVKVPLHPGSKLVQLILMRI
ncbi:MAG: hypothetical protein NC821_06460 [Candidatus Omnitrophica bacterium]|nr:hypothetical protein [Candidatus Omnitrophota bacterium]